MDSTVTSHGIFSELLFRMALEASHNNANGAYSSLPIPSTSSFLTNSGLSPAATILAKLASVPFCSSSGIMPHQPSGGASSTQHATTAVNSITSPTSAAVTLCLAAVGVNPALRRPVLAEMTQPTASNNTKPKQKEDKRSNLEKLINQLKKAKEPEQGSAAVCSPPLVIIDGPDQPTSLASLLNSTNYNSYSSKRKSFEDIFSSNDIHPLSHNDGILSNKFDPQKLGEQVSEIFRSVNSSDPHSLKKQTSKSAKVLTECKECGKAFTSAFQLREHVSIQHLKERNHKCNLCQQRFGRRGGLRRHIQMVHNNHVHKCPYEGCDHPGYKCSKALTAHIRSVHTNDRPFVCNECQKTFVRKNDLKMHSQVHSTDRTFECPCGARFRRQIYLRKHSKTCPLAITAVSISEGGSPAGNDLWPIKEEEKTITGLLSLPFTPELRLSEESLDLKAHMKPSSSAVKVKKEMSEVSDEKNEEMSVDDDEDSESMVVVVD